MGISKSQHLEDNRDRDDEIMTWLKSIGVNYVIYHSSLVNHGYDDLTTLSLMNFSNDSELREIGIQKKGHRKRLLLEIKRLAQQREGD
eukprot:554506_1